MVARSPKGRVAGHSSVFTRTGPVRRSPRFGSNLGLKTLSRVPRFGTSGLPAKIAKASTVDHADRTGRRPASRFKRPHAVDEGERACVVGTGPGIRLLEGSP